MRKSLRAKLWTVPYITSYALFTCCRAVYDISGSMLPEIIWLTFAIAWGTIKVWTTRAVSVYNFDGKKFTLNQDVLEENSWSFGQTPPLVLILLPLLSMAQAYLDNDAKAQEALEHAHNLRESVSKEKHDSECATDSSGQHARNELPGPRTSTSCRITRCNHHPYPHVARAQSDTTSPPPSTSPNTPTIPSPNTPGTATTSSSSSARPSNSPASPFSSSPNSQTYSA